MKIPIIFITSLFLIASVSAMPVAKDYNFVSEVDIHAYQCKLFTLGIYPASIDDCNTLEDITADHHLDYADEEGIGGVGSAGKSIHHLFTLENVNKKTLMQFNVVHNSYSRSSGFQTYSLFVRNFDTSAWELLGQTTIPHFEAGLIEYSSEMGSLSRYVNTNNQMLFMVTEGASSWSSAETDSFNAQLLFDETSPEVQITSPPEGSIFRYLEIVTIRHTASDLDSGLRSCWYTINGDSPKPITCGADLILPIAIPRYSSPQIKYEVKVYAIDKAGNIGFDVKHYKRLGRYPPHPSLPVQLSNENP